MTFAFQLHDFICLKVPRALFTQETLVRLADIAEREITIAGETIRLEATFYTRETLEGEKVKWTRK